MKSYVVQAFSKTSQVVLRFFDDPTAARSTPAERPLPPEPIEAFARDVDAEYARRAPNLVDLGNHLYRWLDGPTERWIERTLAEPAALHIDVDERLRHLPWELLSRDGVYLCANPHRPFSPVRRIAPAATLPLFASAPPPANRPLRVLFMASSPEDVAPVLDFEREESLILDATQRHPIELLVEESGTLEGLKERIDERGSGYFDVFHLTGHADVLDGKPCFLLEDETGHARFISADELARAFSNAWPRLIFLSGCKTGQAVDQGALPSLCEALIRAGAPAVLGWALPVGDHAASLAAKELYDRLATGKSIDEAVAYARCKLFEDNIPDWHLLRLYAGAISLAALVTPERTPQRERLAVRRAQKELLDAGAQVQVCPRERFVGRRRVLQRCLKVLRSREGDAMYAEGLLLHGLGGAGKSSLAARLLDRMLSHRRRFVWVGALDEIAFLRVVSDRCPEAIEILNRPLPLKARSRQVLEGPLAQEPALFVFDDFEHNLDRRSVAAGLKPAALDVLTALLAAIRESASDSRVIVTCRYAFPLPGPARLHAEMLESMRGPELGKKLAQLDYLRSSAPGDPKLHRRAIELGAGNPRLLEWLDKVLAAQEDKALPILLAMGETVEEFREAIFLDGLLKQQTAACRRMLALLSVVNLPVDRATVDAVVAGEVEPHLDQARAVGLIEVVIESETGEAQFLVPGVVRPVLEGEISEEEQKAACDRAARSLYKVWNEREGRTSNGEEAALEIHRLACAGGNKELAGMIGAAIGHNWLDRSRFREVVNLCRATLRLGENYKVLHILANAEEVLGETALAKKHYQEALAQSSAAGSSPQALRTQAAIVNSIALMLARNGQMDQALAMWSNVLSLTPAGTGDDNPLRAAVLHNIAGAMERAGDSDKALKLLRESSSLFEQIRDIKGKAGSLNLIALIRDRHGQTDEALKLWRETLSLQEQAEDARGRAATLNNMATLLMKQGEEVRAVELWHEALALQEQIGDAAGKAQTLYNMAHVLAKRGEVDKALELWGASSALRGKIGDVSGKAQALHNMAALSALHGQVEKASDLWNESLALDDLHMKPISLGNFARFLAQHGEVEKAVEMLSEAFALEAGVGAIQPVTAARLKCLKLEQYKYLAPGTHLVFNDTFNVLLGQNGTGKTTLLDLITRIVTADFSTLKNEVFAIEYELSYPGLTITATLRNDTSTWSSRLVLHIEGLSATYTIAATPFGATLEISDQPGSSAPIRVTTPFDPGHLTGALLKIAEAVEPVHQAPLVAAAVHSAQLAENLFRFDEALGGFQVMTGTPPAERTHRAPSSRFEFSKNHRLAPGLRTFLPAQLWSRLTVLMPDLLTAKGGRLPHTEIDFLKKAVDVMHFKEAEMSLRLLRKEVNPSGERLIYGDFEFLFTLSDGSIINQNDLSYGQKRLLAFFYYAASNEHIVVADELVNGLHHEWIETCRDEIEGRQSFLTSQNPLLLDFLFFSSAEQVRKSFILCRQEDRDGRSSMAAENLSEEEADAFYRAYQTEVQHVSEILRTKGLW